MPETIFDKIIVELQFGKGKFFELCNLYTKEAEYPYYYKGCIDFCDNKNQHKNLCGTHFFAIDGTQYFFDENKNVWVRGAVGFWREKRSHIKENQN